MFFIIVIIIIAVIIGTVSEKDKNNNGSQNSFKENTVTIENLAPVINIVALYAIKKDNIWTSEKVNFVKNIFY